MHPYDQLILSIRFVDLDLLPAVIFRSGSGYNEILAAKLRPNKIWILKKKIGTFDGFYLFCYTIVIDIFLSIFLVQAHTQNCECSSNWIVIFEFLASGSSKLAQFLLIYLVFTVHFLHLQSEPQILGRQNNCSSRWTNLAHVQLGPHFGLTLSKIFLQK